MARPCTRRNAGGASINDSGIFVSTPAVFCALIFTPVQTLAPAQAFTSAFTFASGLPERYIDKNLYRAIKLTLKLFVKGQKYGQLQANFIFRKQPLKA